MTFTKIKSKIDGASPADIVVLANEFDQELQRHTSIADFSNFNFEYREEINELKFTRTNMEGLSDFKKSLEWLVDTAISILQNN